MDNSCVISGIPKNAGFTGTYTVTASNSNGATTSTSILLIGSSSTLSSRGNTACQLTASGRRLADLAVDGLAV
jgi:hypothetical protein